MARSAQSYFAYPTQESCVGDVDNVLSQKGQNNRISYVKDVLVEFTSAKYDRLT